MAFCVIEYLGGQVSGSLALIADAGHMLGDMSALGIAFFASWIAVRRPTHKMTYGFYRVEVLAALINAALLLTIAVGLSREAWERFSTQREIQSSLMIVIAVTGLAINGVVGAMLLRHRRDNINVGAAFYHVVSDALSSIGTVIAGIVVQTTGWYWADPMASLVIAIMIAFSAWRLLKSVVSVLLEASPAHIDTVQMNARVLAIPGVEAIHDLHVWSISPGKESLSAHVEVKEGCDRDRILHEVCDLLSREFNVSHTTLQIEQAKKTRHNENHFHS